MVGIQGRLPGEGERREHVSREEGGMGSSGDTTPWRFRRRENTAPRGRSNLTEAAQALSNQKAGRGVAAQTLHDVEMAQKSRAPSPSFGPTQQSFVRRETEPATRQAGIFSQDL